MNRTNFISVWRLRENIQFGIAKRYQLANGNNRIKFVPQFTRKAARFHISQRMLLSNTGIDFEHEKVFAIRHHNDNDFTAYAALWNGKLYNVTSYIPDDSKIVSYDLITLHATDKNG